MTTDERRAYMAEYMRAYRATHKTAFTIYERARNKLRRRKLTTQEQETAKRVIKSLDEIAAFLQREERRGDIQSAWFFAIGYAIASVDPDTRPPMGEGFGRLNPPTQGE